MLETLWRDIRHGARMLVKNPGFAAVAMLSIAVGVGANAAMFSVADGLVLRPLPVASPGRILSIMATSTGTGFRNPNLSAPEYVDVRDRSHSFDGVVAYTMVATSFAVSREQTAQRKVGMAVSGNFFDAMGVRPASDAPSGPTRTRRAAPSRGGARPRRVGTELRLEPGRRRIDHPHRRHGLHGDRRGPARLHRHRPRRAPGLLRAAGGVDQRAAGAAARRADLARRARRGCWP